MNKKQANEARLLLARLTQIFQSSQPLTHRELKVQAGLLNQAEVAKTLGIHTSRLVRAIDDGLVPAPKHKTAGGRRNYYSPAEVEEMRPVFANNPTVAEKRRGIIGHVTMCYHEKRGRIPAPTRRYPGTAANQHFYSEGEAKAVEKILRKIEGRAPRGHKAK